MDLALTPEQEMLKTAVRRFVQQEYPKDTLLQMAATGISAPSDSWNKLAETGWLGILEADSADGRRGGERTRLDSGREVRDLLIESSRSVRLVAATD